MKKTESAVMITKAQVEKEKENLQIEGLADTTFEKNAIMDVLNLVKNSSETPSTPNFNSIQESYDTTQLKRDFCSILTDKGLTFMNFQDVTNSIASVPQFKKDGSLYTQLAIQLHFKLNEYITAKLYFTLCPLSSSLLINNYTIHIHTMGKTVVTPQTYKNLYNNAELLALIDLSISELKKEVDKLPTEI